MSSLDWFASSCVLFLPCVLFLFVSCPYCSAFTLEQTFSCRDDDPTCVPFTGEEFLNKRGFDSVTIGLNFLWMFIMNVILRTGAYFGLRFLHTGKSFRERWNG